MEKRVTCLGGVDRPVWRSRSKYSTGLSLARGSNGLQLIPPSDARCSISLRDYVQSWIHMLIALTKRKNKKKKNVVGGFQYRFSCTEAEVGGCHGDIALIRIVRIRRRRRAVSRRWSGWLSTWGTDTHTHTDKMDDAFDVGNTGQCVCACVVIYDLCQSTHSCIS